MTKSISLVYLSYLLLMMANSGIETDNNPWKTVQIKIILYWHSWILIPFFVMIFFNSLFKFEAYTKRIKLSTPGSAPIISIVTS